MLRAAVAALLLLAMGAAAGAAPREQEYRRLRGEQLRARILDRDITDDFHWTEYYRRDGVLQISAMGRRTVGRWRLERDQLCIQRPPRTDFECLQFWVMGDEVSLRAFDGDQPYPAFIRRHERN